MWKSLCENFCPPTLLVDETLVKTYIYLSKKIDWMFPKKWTVHQAKLINIWSSIITKSVMSFKILNQLRFSTRWINLYSYLLYGRWWHKLNWFQKIFWLIYDQIIKKTEIKKSFNSHYEAPIIWKET